MRIIHLTDIHLSTGNLKDFEQFYLKALIEDLSIFNSNKKIDLILITGDLADKGGKSFISDKKDPFEEFTALFIDPILDSLGLDYNNLFICPGNHDINESKIDEYIEKGIQSNHNTITKINDYIDEYKNTSHLGIDRISDFKSYEKKLAGLQTGIINEISNFDSNYALKVKGTNVGIACLNSAWRSSTKLPPNALTFGTRQILNSNDFFKRNKTQFNIALLHHPFEFFASIERTEIENLLLSLDFNILLTGHIHSSNNVYFNGPRGKLFLNVAKSAFGNPRETTSQFKPGYTIIDVEFLPIEYKITSHFRQYVHNRIRFDKDVESADDGVYISFIKLDNNSSRVFELVKLTNDTYRAKLDNINTSLLIYGTDSVAPRNLDDIFVLPILTDSPPTFGIINKDNEHFSIEDVIYFNQSIILIGDKESGKTTLLNKFFLEISHNFSKFNLIPIKLNYSELIKKEIKPLIKDFLNEPNSDVVESYLKDKIILLLIDEYVETEQYYHARLKLKRFLAEYPSNNIFLTTSIQLNDLIISEDSLFGEKEENLKHTEFKPIFIGAVGGKQFKELSIKWFNKKDTDWMQNNLEKLIKVFEILKTPRTFFSVSLFLWIIEKQESFRPVNKSSLLHRFLLYILKGLRIEDTEAGKYTFEKKVEILRELALEMYYNGEKFEEYSLTRDQILSTIKKNFALNQLKLNEIEKYDEFLDKGLLKKVHSSERFAFRYEAFFQYFLSLNIDKSKEFKALVFKDENFLGFIDELDYYTGSSRDDKITLQFSIDKLHESFEEVDKIMKGNLDDYFPKTSFLVKKDNKTSIIEEAKKNKLTDKQIEENLGEKLEMLPVQESIRVKESENYKNNFPKVLELACRILKNSENIQDPEIVNSDLDLIVNKAAKYGIFIQSIIVSNIDKHKNDLPITPEALIAIAPIVNEELLLKWLGTDFLEVPLEKKLESLLTAKKGEFSEYELFLTVFVYCDLKLSNYTEYLASAIKKIDNLYINELFLIKVIYYYNMRSNSSSLLPKFESMLNDLIVKIRNISKSKAEKLVDKLKVRKFGSDHV